MRQAGGEYTLIVKNLLLDGERCTSRLLRIEDVSLHARAAPAGVLSRIFRLRIIPDLRPRGGFAQSVPRLWKIYRSRPAEDLSSRRTAPASAVRVGVHRPTTRQARERGRWRASDFPRLQRAGDTRAGDKSVRRTGTNSTPARRAPPSAENPLSAAAVRKLQDLLPYLRRELHDRRGQARTLHRAPVGNAPVLDIPANEEDPPHSPSRSSSIPARAGLTAAEEHAPLSSRFLGSTALSQKRQRHEVAGARPPTADSHGRGGRIARIFCERGPSTRARLTELFASRTCDAFAASGGVSRGSATCRLQSRAPLYADAPMRRAPSERVAVS